MNKKNEEKAENETNNNSEPAQTISSFALRLLIYNAKQNGTWSKVYICKPPANADVVINALQSDSIMLRFKDAENDASLGKRADAVLNDLGIEFCTPSDNAVYPVGKFHLVYYDL